jgi:predicted  nucleic acid-binding Zn-ribbon protein
MIECPGCNVRFKAKFRRPIAVSGKKDEDVISCPACGHLMPKEKQ